MRVSREAKILVALVAVAAATWVWVNYFTQQPTLNATSGATLNVAAPSTTPGATLDPVAASENEVDPAVVAALGEALVALPGTLPDEPALPVIASTSADEVGTETSDDLVSSESGGEPTAVDASSVVDKSVVAVAPADSTLADSAPAESAPAESGGVTLAVPETGGVPSVADTSVADTSVADTGPSVAQSTALTARELNVAELPFLVTAPPSTDLAEGVTADGELELARPREELRASVNPFSPILLDAPPEQPVANLPPPEPAPDTSLIQTVEIPAAPPVDAVTPTALAPVVPERVTAPAPRAVTPSSLQNGSLPKALPGGTLPSTPKLLRNTRQAVVATPDTPTGPDSLAAVAAVRVPGERQASGFKTAAAPTLSASAETPEVAPLRFGGLPEPALAGGPLAAGTSSLSRYLRDTNYQFTGSVIGPVGVGVFRSKLSNVPVLVSLGQTLPDTEIVLTSLQGKQAEFTQNGNKQLLILDLR